MNRASFSQIVVTCTGLVGLAAVLGACGGNTQPSIMTIVPSVTYTTAALPAAATVITTQTATPVPATPTSHPATSGPSPTSPLAPTRSPVPRTQTATAATGPNEAGNPAIEYFTTNSESVAPGGSVTLFWSVRGAERARIFRLNADDERIFRWDVAASDEITVTTGEDDHDVARFLLTAEVDGAEVDQLLVIPLQCSETWFFSPGPGTCPAGPPQISDEAEQTFERGRMIWVGSQDRVYVLFDDGDSPGWTQYPDNFEEGTPERDDTLAAPAGLQQPIRGFGLIWRENARVRERLGWATSPEVPFEGMFQSNSNEPDSGVLYLRTRDGGILGLDTTSNEWESVPLPTDTSGAPAF
ncbi:MAG: hypothetical protein JW966_11815 [Anaerolineae bacterium]|nr:hypothetical protein [Anaerolineae bacterium]